ncbi:hypothetical protein RI129_004275 [Pyrocoelia pectoralis]|uniref:Uncharacterized protein n=1 Tax=Pyrocoelia pectoralis TaxID=417401 RepID=A0AAN7VIJ9_9COLE
MDADSSYGGSDTAQDSTLGHDNNSLETSNTHDEVDKSVMSSNDANTYFKNEVTLPINFNEGEEKSSLPHYLSTAKLNIEESVDTQQLDDLSKNYSSTHNLNAENPKSRRSGIDNPAYEEEEKVHTPPSNGALKSTFDENKTYTNGDLNTSPTLTFSSPNKNEEQMAEAVNLELINLKPAGKDVVGGYGGTNGINDIPIKKETEVELGNPYDEYFVPVNEHRKYMRGEKLYVTKDKRDKKKRNKCLCWSICLVFVAAAVIVGVLAAVGIIGNQEAQPVQGARQFSDSPDAGKTKVKSAGGLFGIEDTSEESPPLNNYPVTSEPAIITVDNHPPTTDTSKIEVPRALESQLIIDNLQFSEELAHKNSSEFRNLAESVEKQLMKTLFSDEDTNGGAKIYVKVVEFMPGSVVVKYRVSWIFTDGGNTKDPIDKESLNKKLTNTLNENYGYLDGYHIPESTIATEKIINMCQIGNNGCEHSCSFDYEINDFKCECPINKQLSANEKTCVNIIITEPSPSTEPESITDFEFEPSHVNHHEQGRSHDGDIYAEPEPQPEPKTTTTTTYHDYEAELPAHHEHNTHMHAMPESTPEPEPEPSPNTQYEPEPTFKPKPELELHTEHTYHGYENLSTEPEHMTTQHDSNLHAYTVSHMSPESTVKPEPEPEPSTPHVYGNPTVKPEPEPEINAKSSTTTHEYENVGTVKPEPNTQEEQHIHVQMVSDGYETVSAEPEPTAKPEPEPHQDQDLYPYTTSHFSEEPKQTVKPEPEPQQDQDLYVHTTPHLSVDPEQTVKPEPEPQQDPVLYAHTTPHFNVESEQKVKPEPEPHQDQDLHTYTNPHFSVEPEQTMKPEPEPQQDQGMHTTPHVNVEPEQTVKPEPEPQQDQDLHAHTTPHFSVEPEQTVKPEPEPQQDQDLYAYTNPHFSVEPEQTMKPEPEPQQDQDLYAHTTSHFHVEPELTVKPEPEPEQDQDLYAHTNPHFSVESEQTVKPEPERQQEQDLYAHTTSHLSVQPDHTMKPDPEPEQSTMKHEGDDHPRETTVHVPTAKTQAESNVEVVGHITSSPPQESPTTPALVPAVELESGPLKQPEPSSVSDMTPPPTKMKQTQSPNTETEQVTELKLNLESNVLPTITTPQPHTDLEDTTSMGEMTVQGFNHTSVKETDHYQVPEMATVVDSATTMRMEEIGHTDLESPHTTQRLMEKTTIRPDAKNSHEMINSMAVTTEIMMDQESENNRTTSETFTSNMKMENDEESSTHINENYISREGKLSDDITSFETSTNFMTTVKHVEQGSIAPEMTTIFEKTENEASVTVARETNDTENLYVPVSVQDNDLSEMDDKVTHMHVTETTTQKSDKDYMVIPVIVDHARIENAEHSTHPSIKEDAVEKVMDMYSSDSTENVHNFDNMSPFLPDIDNDTLVNNLHSEMDAFTESSYHVNETDMYSSSENPPRLDSDEMNETNPQDRHPIDAVLSVLPLDNDTLKSNEIVNKIERVPITKKLKIENAKDVSELNVTQSVIMDMTTTKAARKEVTLSPDIINNVHSNNYFLKLQTSTEAEHRTEPFPNKDNTKPSENNISTEDLIAQETTTNKLQETTVKNATTVQVVTEKVYVIDDRTEKPSEDVPTTQMSVESNSTSSHPSSETHQYEVHENLSEDITTIRNIIQFSTTELPKTPPPVIPLSEENGNTKQEKKRADDKFNRLEPVENIYDHRELLNDINDDDKFHENTKKGNGHNLLITDFMEQPTFTSAPHYNKEVDEEHDFYLQNLKNATLTSDVKPVTEGFTISHFSRCASGQFQCFNGTAIKGSTYCISDNDRCDSVDDCTDASDEVGCAEEKCLGNFQCKNDQCLKRLLVCNGIADCTDGSDEVDCESWKCGFDEFSCGEGSRCIPLSMRCDGRKDCPKGDDEHSCYSQQCQSDEYRCSDKETCIPASWRCDGERDCMEGDDENLCECAFDQFKCVKGGGCIPKNQMCDGIEQCPDFSDEWNCFRLQEVVENTNYVEVRPQNMSWLQVCSSLWNSSHSDIACQKLGFAGSASTEFIKLKANSTLGYYKLKELQSNNPLLTQLEKTEDCDSIVSITCQDFECGSQTSSDVPSARIIGGNRASETQWPGVVLLYNKKYHVQCTSTVIAPNWVLASYSCVLAEKHLRNDVNEWVLYAGGTNFSVNMNNGTQLRLIRKIIPHPQAKYSEIVYSNDIVIIQLDMPLNLGSNVSAICLPNTEIEPRQLCVTAGWGVKTPGESGRQEYLHYLPVPTLDIAQCNSSEHYNGRLTKDKICAGYTDSDRTPCYNDEGAPLMCFSETSNTWELQGLLSHHANCGRNRHPALYTSVNRETREWIRNTTGMHLMVNERVAPS